MDLSHLPWYAKMFLALGGAGILWKFAQSHIATIFEWLTPFVLRAVDTMMALALVHPAVRWFVFGNKANVEAMLTAICDGLEGLVDKIEKRMIANIDAEAAKDAAKPAVPCPPPAEANQAGAAPIEPPKAP